MSGQLVQYSFAYGWMQEIDYVTIVFNFLLMVLCLLLRCMLRGLFVEETWMMDGVRCVLRGFWLAWQWLKSRRVVYDIVWFIDVRFISDRKIEIRLSCSDKIQCIFVSLYHKLKLRDSQTAQLYRLTKVHKASAPVRPVCQCMDRAIPTLHNK